MSWIIQLLLQLVAAGTAIGVAAAALTMDAAGGVALVIDGAATAAEDGGGESLADNWGIYK